MATQTRAPTGDGTFSGTWTGTVGSRYQLVDDYPDTVPTDYLDHGTTAGYANFTWDVLTVPAGATNISVQLQYYDQDVTSGNNNIAGRIRVGGTTYNATSHNPSTTLTAREDNWALNPFTGLAWTVDDVNGVGANALDRIGWTSTDANPAIRLSCLRLQVTYTPPMTGSLAKTLGSVTLSAAGRLVWQGSLAQTLGGVSLSAAGTVANAGVQGSLAKTLGGVTLSGAGRLALHGSLAKTLGAVTLSAAGHLALHGSLAKTLGSVTLSAAGTVAAAWVHGSLAKTLGGVTLSAAGTVMSMGVHGSLARTLGGVTVTATGTVVEPPPPVQRTRIEQIALVTFLDAEAPTFIDFLGGLREWTADITFLDLLELQVEIWMESKGIAVGPGSPATGVVDVPAYYDDGDEYDRNEYA